MNSTLFMPVSVVGAVYFITSIYRMDFLFVDLVHVCDIGVYFRDWTYEPGLFYVEDGYHSFKWLLII